MVFSNNELFLSTMTHRQLMKSQSPESDEFRNSSPSSKAIHSLSNDEKSWVIKEDGTLILKTCSTSRDKYLDLSGLGRMLGTISIHSLNEVKFSYSFPFLQHLNIRNQRITELSTVGGILSLRHLDASKNQIVSKSISSLQTCKLLQTLILNDNLIDFLPTVFTIEQ